MKCILPIVAFVALGLVSSGQGFKQELWLYMDGGNALYFDTQDPNLTDYAALLQRVNQVCATGKWTAHTDVNYQTYKAILGSAVLEGAIYCHGDGQWASSWKSLRYMGANDTSVNALSLYPLPNYSGPEIFIDVRAYTGITSNITSFAATGDSKWMLYEGTVLNGTSVCLTPKVGWSNTFDDVKALNLTTIGSVFQGCNLHEIELFKEENKLF